MRPQDAKHGVDFLEEQAFFDGLSLKGQDADVRGVLLPRGSAEKFLFSGLFFLGVWLLAQGLSARPVLEILVRLPETMDSGDLLSAASMLVLMNALRAIALYLGWFLLGNGLGALHSSLSFLSWFVPVVAIPVTYFILPSLGEGIQLHFGFPAVLSVSSVLVLRYLTRGIADWGYKAIALALFVFSFQWLDVIPALTSWGAGWGELSSAVKTVALLMEREYLLNRAGIAVFGGLFCAGVITTELLVSYGARLYSLALLRDRENKVALLREQNLRNRSLVEMQQLVHDLKRPLTTIMGLADVIASGKNAPSAGKYGAVIVEAGRSMEEMISEILHEDFRRPISLGDLLQYVFTQISPFDWRQTVSLSAEEGILDEYVTVNVVRLSRALVNLLENAHRANSLVNGSRIAIRISGTENLAEIAVLDEGPGFRRTRGEGGAAPSKVEGASGEWWGSSSGWNSTGLGLQYVTMVVRNHGGRFIVEDLPGGGARTAIALEKNPVVKESSRAGAAAFGG